jgi:hypothetical protein
MARMMVPGTRSLTTAIVSEIASAEDVDVLDVPPLFDSVDPDALESLAAAADETARLTVEFDHSGYRIRVEDGRVSVDSLPQDP